MHADRLFFIRLPTDPLRPLPSNTAHVLPKQASGIAQEKSVNGVAGDDQTVIRPLLNG